MSGRVGRVEPLQSHDGRHFQVRDRPRDTVQPAFEGGSQLLAAIRDSGSPGQPDYVVQDSLEVDRILPDDLGATRQIPGDLGHVLERDRADRADLLGDDQIGPNFGERFPVEPVEGVAPTDCLFHRGIDTGCRQSSRNGGAGKVGESEGLLGPVAFMGHSDHLIAEPEGEEHLGRGWNETYNPHRKGIWHFSIRKR